MTQQEQQLLNGLIDRVNGTQLASKDTEAEALLQRTLGTNPDALYILCQTVLVQGFAMDKGQRDLAAAREEIDSLRQAQPEKHGSFLGNLFGLGKDDEQQQQPPRQGNPAPGYSNPTGYGAPSSTPGYAPVTNAPAPPQQGYPVQPGYGQPGYGQPAYGYPPQGAPYGYGGQPQGGMFGGGGGGFLQGAMQTAAGVVAGEFAFRAIEDVFSGFGHGGGERGFGGGEVVNNYYEDRPADSGGGGFGDRLAKADDYNGGVSSDIEDRRGESHGFLGSSDDSGNDGSNFADDSGSFDDGGFDGGDRGGDDNSY
ncbi:DUF2076 domain-containing protein [Terriglobus roseus]|uniref:DUF2076 domain-containing protein n=1 Tax=Terriglobus roseus TaxID=392734 RepID=A0A1H4LSG8_9BACT|nr:DUF2076 domain-containing protein [Terriglobus roseus]SEB73613.1 hypothetical protein SAMN05443244_1699 [Terriglobus roseus]